MKLIRITQNVLPSRLGFASAFLSGGLSLTCAFSTLGDPIFTDATLSAGLNGMGFTFGAPIWGDFNNDGNLDLFVDNYYREPPYLYQNNGDGTFTDIFPTSGINEGGDRQGSAWVDFDNDSDLDLSFIKGASGGHALGRKKDELYRNRGAGQFRNIATQAGVTNTFGRGRGVACGDYNNDGFLDLLVANFKTDLVLYKNNGDGTFVDVTAPAGLAGLQYTECVFADYNNAGLNAELIFHTDPPKDCHRFVDRAEVRLTSLFLDLFPPSGETDAGEVWISPDGGLEGSRVRGGFGNFLGDP